MARGTGRSARNDVLDALSEDDPEAYEELLALRHHNPQRFRKRLRAVVAMYCNTGSKAQRGRGAKLAEQMPRLRARRYILAPEIGDDGLNDVTRRALEGLERERSRGHANVQGVVVSVQQMGSTAQRRQTVDRGSILNGPIGALKKALSTGEFDPYLDELLAEESAGRNRKGALTAIAGRQRAVS